MLNEKEKFNNNYEFAQKIFFQMKGEEDFLCELLKDKNMREKHKELAKTDIAKLWQKAKKIIYAMENGTFKDKEDKWVVIGEEESKKLETELSLILSAIEFPINENVLELLP